jgi:hypothetical protein
VGLLMWDGLCPSGFDSDSGVDFAATTNEIKFKTQADKSVRPTQKPHTQQWRRSGSWTLLCQIWPLEEGLSNPAQAAPQSRYRQGLPPA